MNRNDSAIIGFVMVSHAIVHTFELSIPILMVIWFVEFSATKAELGLIVAVGYSLFGLGGLPSGILSDRFGSRRLVVGCLVGMGLSFVFLSLARNLAMIAVALCLWGLSASIYHPAGLSLISTGIKERGAGFAYHGIAGNFGIAFGPLLTAVLLLVLDWRIVTTVLAIPTAIAAMYAMSIDFDETAAVEVEGGTAEYRDLPMSLSRFIADSRSLFTVGFTLAFCVVLMNGLFYRGTVTFLPDMMSGFLADLPMSFTLFAPGSRIGERFDLASYLYTALLIVGIAGQYVGGRLTDRVRPERGIAVLFGLLTLVAVVFVPVAQAGILSLLVASALLGFLLFALQPLYQALIAEYSPPGYRGLSYGYTYLGSFGIGATGAGIAGYLLSSNGAGTTFLGLALFPAGGAILAGVLSTVDARRT